MENGVVNSSNSSNSHSGGSDGGLTKKAIQQQPDTTTSSLRAGRLTNQLKFIQHNVVKSLWKHTFSWPFQKPVDAVALKLPVI